MPPRERFEQSGTGISQLLLSLARLSKWLNPRYLCNSDAKVKGGTRAVSVVALRRTRLRMHGRLTQTCDGSWLHHSVCRPLQSSKPKYTDARNDFPRPVPCTPDGVGLQHRPAGRVPRRHVGIRQRIAPHAAKGRDHGVLARVGQVSGAGLVRDELPPAEPPPAHSCPAETQAALCTVAGAVVGTDCFMDCCWYGEAKP
jgi:hypothetical protein